MTNGHGTAEERFLAAYGALPERRSGDRMFKFDMRHYLAALLTSEDRLSMAFSVESRVPLLDYRIAELAGRVGFERKAEPGRSKHLLRTRPRRHRSPRHPGPPRQARLSDSDRRLAARPAI